MKFSSQVRGARRESLPLPDYLADRFTYHDRAAWIEKIAQNRLSIDGCTASIGDTVTPGQTVTYDAGDFTEPPADLGYSILYEDEWILAVNKPGNLLIHRAGHSFRNNLMHQLRFVHSPPYPSACSVHRLDRNTSGAVLVAKTGRLQAELSLQFASRRILKTYLALVHGIPDPGIERIDSPLSKDPSWNAGSRFRIDPGGKEAITLIHDCVPVGEGFAALTLRPLTGRTHQLRVHCASIGHPIVGDRTYGSTIEFESRKGAETGIPGVHHQRHALHCSEIRFFHPWLEREFRIEAPVPEDMLTMEKKLGEIRMGV